MNELNGPWQECVPILSRQGVLLGLKHWITSFTSDGFTVLMTGGVQRQITLMTRNKNALQEPQKMTRSIRVTPEPQTEQNPHLSRPVGVGRLTGQSNLPSGGGRYVKFQIMILLHYACVGSTTPLCLALYLSRLKWLLQMTSCANKIFYLQNKIKFYFRR